MSHGEQAFNADQRDSHPPPFTYLGPDGLPYKAMVWGDGRWWVFFWHPEKRWVSLRLIGPEELRVMRTKAMKPEHAKLYDDLHAKHG